MRFRVIYRERVDASSKSTGIPVLFPCGASYNGSGDGMKRIGIMLLSMLLLCGCAARSEPLQQVTAVEKTENACYVALTFDDGPSAKYTPMLLDGLKERGVHATFFLIGSLIEGNEALVQRIKAEGHQIGNHSYDHAKLTEMTCATALADIARGNEALCQTLGEDDYWVRPPYGFIGEETSCAVSAPLISWSVDTLDWKTKDTGKILDIVYRDYADGAIILMHDQYAATVEAALQAIDHLQAQGVKFVTVRELFACKGVVPACGKLYRMVK